MPAKALLPISCGSCSRRRCDMIKRSLKKRLGIVIAVLAILVSGLAVTSYAIIRYYVQISGNEISMSEGLELNLNDGKPVIDTSAIVYEPGGTYRTEFTVENLVIN